MHYQGFAVLITYSLPTKCCHQQENVSDSQFSQLKYFFSCFFITDFLVISSGLLCVLSCEPPFFQKGDYCVYITQPTGFSNDCNVQTYHPFHVSLYENLETYVWMPVGRRYNFGPMVFQKPGLEYAETLETAVKNIEYDGQFTPRADCIIIANKTLKYVDCLEKHPHLCAYYAHSRNGCISPAVLSFKSCFCKLINDSEEKGGYGEDDDEEEEDEEEEYACELKTDFTTDEKITEMVAVPETIGLNVCYVNQKSRSTCRVEGRNVPKVDLILKFEEKRRKLFLTVYSLEG